ncbi:hypothetical protein [Nocardia wallacei]|uniref:hypothetical protein n=1 Tax=Nocardia wallacei TaxID=480035 RepID=UPI002458EEA6|nr:hypothetical protein [Nocardia wallacei]
MATAAISMDDHLFAHVQEAAGDDLSAWIAAACRYRLLSDGVRDAAAETAAALTDDSPAAPETGTAAAARSRRRRNGGVGARRAVGAGRRLDRRPGPGRVLRPSPVVSTPG